MTFPRPSLLAGLAASSLILLAGCGAGTGDAGSSLQTRLAALVSSTSTTATFSGKRADYTITRSGTGYAVKENATGKSDTVPASVTTLVFGDYTVNLGIGEKSKSISASDLRMLVELYVAFFNRVPDADGLAYWIDERKGGKSIDEIGGAFYNAAVSPQYSAFTGYSANMSNGDFIAIIYRNVLGRSSVDAEGLKYWDDALKDGTKTRGALVREILTAAHTYKGDATYGSVADLLDNKYTVGATVALNQGLTSTAPANDAYAKAVSVAALVTSTNTASAIAAVGAGDAAFNLPDLSLVVSNVALSTPMYRKLATITVTGAGLTGAINVSATNCASLAESANSSSTQRSYTCLPTTIGNIEVTVLRSSDNAGVGSASGTVPLPQILMKTSEGDMTLELNPVNAPITTINFLRYVNDGFYSNTLIHRSVRKSTDGIDIIQGGGFNTAFQTLTTYGAIKLEWPNGLSNTRGTIAMARTGVLDSATSQWFINTTDNVTLDANGGGYAVFGRMLSGFEVMDKIQIAPVSSGTAGGNTFVSIPYPVITTLSVTQIR